MNDERDAAFVAVKAAVTGLVPPEFKNEVTAYLTDEKILTIANIAIEAAPHLVEHVHARAMVREAILEMIPGMVLPFVRDHVTDDKVAIITDAALSAAAKVRAATANA